jgi:16S rRNA (guanine966-N2)-methyltransferase
MAATTRITAGEWRGRVIETPRGMSIRPTRALIRQSLFNIVGEAVVDAGILDLYAGAGTVGFEALSRGAMSATFVDRDPAAHRVIAATAQRLGCAGRCRIVRSDVAAWVRRNAGAVRAAGLVFVDAPYRDDELMITLELLGAHAPALAVCEHHVKRRLPERIGALVQARETRHGLTTLTFLQRSSDGAGAT